MLAGELRTSRKKAGLAWRIAALALDRFHDHAAISGAPASSVAESCSSELASEARFASEWWASGNRASETAPAAGKGREIELVDRLTARERERAQAAPVKPPSRTRSSWHWPKFERCSCKRRARLLAPLRRATRAWRTKAALMAFSSGF